MLSRLHVGAVWLAIVATVAPADAARRGRERNRAAYKRQRVARNAQSAQAPGFGKVVYRTRKRTYLARGQQDGLSEGQVVRFVREGMQCTLLDTADRFALCDDPRPRLNSSFRLAKTQATERPQRIEREGPPTRTQLQQARVALQRAAPPSVEFEGGFAPRVGLAQTSLDYGVWASGGRQSYQQVAVNLLIRDAPLGSLPLRGDVSLTALRWLQRPQSRRFRPNEDSQLYVWDLAVSTRNLDFDAAVGRLATTIPGLLVLDGARVGFRNAGVLAELGAFGGTLPDFINLKPTADRWTGGIYYALRSSDRSSLYHGARLAVVNRAENVITMEVQPAFRARLFDGLSVGVEAQASAPQDNLNNVTLDFAYADLQLDAVSNTFLSIASRYVSDAGAQAFTLNPLVVVPQAAIDGDVNLGWRASSWLNVRANGYVRHQPNVDRTRVLVGPEIEALGLLRDHLSLALGYREELSNNIAGRFIYLRGRYRTGPRFWISAQASYTSDALDPDLVQRPLREVGLQSLARLRLFDGISLQVSVLGRLGLSSVLGQDFDRNRAGVTSRVSLIGQL